MGRRVRADRRSGDVPRLVNGKSYGMELGVPVCRQGDEYGAEPYGDVHQEGYRQRRSDGEECRRTEQRRVAICGAGWWRTVCMEYQ